MTVLSNLKRAVVYVLGHNWLLTLDKAVVPCHVLLRVNDADKSQFISAVNIPR